MQSDIRTDEQSPLTERGYLVTSLADYLTAAQRRVDQLQADLAAAVARRAEADSLAAALTAERQRLGARWLEAQERAEAILRQAELEATDIIDEARATAERLMRQGSS